MFLWLSLCLAVVSVIGLFFGAPALPGHSTAEVLFAVALCVAMAKLFLGDATRSELRRPGSLYSLR